MYNVGFVVVSLFYNNVDNVISCFCCYMLIKNECKFYFCVCWLDLRPMRGHMALFLDGGSVTKPHLMQAGFFLLSGRCATTDTAYIPRHYIVRRKITLCRPVSLPVRPLCNNRHSLHASTLHRNTPHREILRHNDIPRHI